jgi:hypothetical protein
MNTPPPPSPPAASPKTSLIWSACCFIAALILPAALMFFRDANLESSGTVSWSSSLLLLGALAILLVGLLAGLGFLVQALLRLRKSQR